MQKSYLKIMRSQNMEKYGFRKHWWIYSKEPIRSGPTPDLLDFSRALPIWVMIGLLWVLRARNYSVQIDNNRDDRVERLTFFLI